MIKEAEYEVEDELTFNSIVDHPHKKIVYDRENRVILSIL